MDETFFNFVGVGECHSINSLPPINIYNTRYLNIPVIAMGGTRWTENEDRALIENYQNEKLSFLREILPNRSDNGIHVRAQRLGLTQPQEHHLKNGFQKDESLEQRFGEKKAKKLKESLSENGRLQPYAYSKKEEEIIKESYGKKPLCEWLGLLNSRSNRSVYNKARKMGLTRERGFYNLGGFKKGSTWKENFDQETQEKLLKMITYVGKHKTKEQLEKIRQSNIGKIRNEETRKKISIINKKRWENITEEQKNRLHLFKDGHESNFKGKTWEEIYGEERASELKKLASKSKKKLYKKQDVWNKGLTKEEHPSLLSASIKKTGFHHSEETKVKLREARVHQVIPSKDSDIEIMLQEELNNRKIEYKTHVHLKGQPDIAFPDKKVVVFADGCYWHGCPICDYSGPERRDKSRDERVTKFLESKGWRVLRFWGHEIRKNPSQVVDKIMEVYNNG